MIGKSEIPAPSVEPPSYLTAHDVCDRGPTSTGISVEHVTRVSETYDCVFLPRVCCMLGEGLAPHDLVTGKEGCLIVKLTSLGVDV